MLNLSVLPVLEVKYGCCDDCTVPELFCKEFCEGVDVISCWLGDMMPCWPAVRGCGWLARLA